MATSTYSPENTEDQQTLWSLIKDIRFGMLTHRHESGVMHSIPLTTQNDKNDQASTLYFFIRQSSELARHVWHDPHVHVSYADPSEDSYVLVSGIAKIVDDPAKKESLFSTIDKAWFPGGPTDPELALLEVSIGQAEYWDSKHSKMMKLAIMLKSALTGEAPQDLSEHKQLNLS